MYATFQFITIDGDKWQHISRIFGLPYTIYSMDVIELIFPATFSDK
jgi:hypothetical protein